MRLSRRSLEISTKYWGPDHPEVARPMNNLAACHAAHGHYAEAVRLLKRSLSVLKRALGPDHPEVATVLNNLAGVHRHRGSHAKAERLYRRSLAIRERALGPQHPETRESLLGYVDLLRQTGREAEASRVEQTTWQRQREARAESLVQAQHLDAGGLPDRRSSPIPGANRQSTCFPPPRATQ
jgi:Tfp pilus assembly protein PilF